jgi:hypothetical protein
MFSLFQTCIALKCFMLQVFRVSEVCSESHEAWPGHWGRCGELGAANGAYTALGVLRSGRARPHLGSRVSLERREEVSGE